MKCYYSIIPPFHYSCWGYAEWLAGNIIPEPIRPELARGLAESHRRAGGAVGNTGGCIDRFHPAAAVNFTQVGVVQIGNGFFGQNQFFL